MNEIKDFGTEIRLPYLLDNGEREDVIERLKSIHKNMPSLSMEEIFSMRHEGHRY